MNNLIVFLGFILFGAGLSLIFIAEIEFAGYLSSLTLASVLSIFSASFITLFFIQLGLAISILGLVVIHGGLVTE